MSVKRRRDRPIAGRDHRALVMRAAPERRFLRMTRPTGLRADEPRRGRGVAAARGRSSVVREQAPAVTISTSTQGRSEQRHALDVRHSTANPRRCRDSAFADNVPARKDQMTTDLEQPPTNRTWIERVLSPVAEVHRDEVTSALLMTLVMFMILAAYYLLKTAREVFILSEGGAEVKSYSSAGQALLLLVLVPLYSSFASRVKRVQLVQWVTVFFASHLLLFLFALGAGVRSASSTFSGLASST